MVSWPQKKAGCIVVTRMEPQQPTKAMIVGSRIPPKPKSPRIASTTFEAEGVRLPPQKLKELKAIATERDEQRKRATGGEEWRKLKHPFMQISENFYTQQFNYHLIII